MLGVMFEDGPDAFLQRWRAYASDAVLFARPEGSPLLEAEVGGAVVQLLERTNPYIATPGSARLVVNATVPELTACEADEPELSVPHRGALAGCGRVLEREGRLVAVDAATPVLLACEVAPDGDVAPGAWVRFEAAPPVHGFVLPPERRRESGDGRSIDEAP
jgi:hypothetical protein